MSEGIKRRDFLRVAGVTGAGTGLVGCSTEQVEKLIPYVTAPEEITPGVATWYSTVCGECSAGCGAWVKTREGRAIKLEGNPNHPISGGALCARGQSALQGLYDPDRLTSPMRRGAGGLEPIPWEEAESLLLTGVRDAAPAVALVSRKAGPTLGRLEAELMAEAGGQRIEYDATSEAPLREAARIVFGSNAVPAFDFRSAGIVFSFGADFLGSWVSPVEHTRGFATASAAEEGGGKSPFVFIGPRLSLTGQNADEWVPVAPGAEALVALAIANVIAREGGDAGSYADLLQAYGPETVSAQVGLTVETIEDLAARFVAEGPGLAVGPGIAAQGANATAANVAVLLLNAVGGAVGQTLRPLDGHLSVAASPAAGLAAVIDSMEGGEIQALILHNVNPAYTLPPGFGFSQALASVPFSVAITDRLDETAVQADLVLPDRHFLESWGDSNPRPGLWALQQPAMQPVPHFDSRAGGDILLGLAAGLGQDPGAADYHDYLRSAWSDLHAGLASEEPFETFWRRALRDGIVELPDEGAAGGELQPPDRAMSFDAPELEGDGLALIVYPSDRFGDGRSANRPWLQELADPVSKIAWHSWIEIHPETATELGVSSGDVVRVTSPNGEVEVPVWAYPGIRRDAAALAMGGGHTSFGRYADGRGANPMTLLPPALEQTSGGLVHLATRVTIEPTGEHRGLATIEGASDQRHRPIAPAVELEALLGGEIHEEEHAELYELQAVGGFVPVEAEEGIPEAYPLEGARYGEYDPEAAPRWAMAIDLDKCTGCSACITACQSENNVATVGEDQVRMGRDLAWIRLERFYETVDADMPGPLDIRFLPMLCQHCGNAPCEPVCPVYAAYHTPDGLNAQVYNRCVGTRYCANNCPYKVRVFNWFNFSDVPEPLNWQYNPDVTVRTGGIMEKCSFCVQRIRQAENRATLEGRSVEDGDVVPACQQGCPAEAIVFGNIRDPASRVAQLSASDRTYRVLDVLINTQPAVNYLRKVTLHAVEDIHV